MNIATRRHGGSWSSWTSTGTATEPDGVGLDQRHGLLLRGACGHRSRHQRLGVGVGHAPGTADGHPGQRIPIDDFAASGQFHHGDAFGSGHADWGAAVEGGMLVTPRQRKGNPSWLRSKPLRAPRVAVEDSDSQYGPGRQGGPSTRFLYRRLRVADRIQFLYIGGDRGTPHRRRRTPRAAYPYRRLRRKRAVPSRRRFRIRTRRLGGCGGGGMLVTPRQRKGNPSWLRSKPLRAPTGRCRDSDSQYGLGRQGGPSTRFLYRRLRVADRIQFLYIGGDRGTPAAADGHPGECVLVA